MAHPAMPVVVDVRHVERGGEDRRAAAERRLVEEGDAPHVHRDRLGLPVRARRLDRDDRVRLRLVVERERQRAGEPARLADRRERRSVAAAP